MSRAGWILALVLTACINGEASRDDGSFPDEGPKLIHRVFGGAGPARGEAGGAERTGEIQQALAPSDTNGISYHGGPVMTAVNAYYIWYGNWAGNSAQAILSDLASTISQSAYWKINTTYFGPQPDPPHVTGTVRLAGQTMDAYSRNTSLDESSVFSVVSDAITSGRLPNDPAGVYFVLTSADVDQAIVSNGTRFCVDYCGWHTHRSFGGTSIKYAWIGDPSTRCPDSCMAQATGPNGNAGADAMASTIAHELEETATDPDQNAWRDDNTDHVENADRCEGQYGTEYFAPNGAHANMRLFGRDFLIQQNWVNARGGYCGSGLHYDTQGGILASAPAVASMDAHQSDVFARGTDNALWHRNFGGAGVWSPWESLGGILTSAPAAVSPAPGRLDVFARGLDNSLVHRTYTTVTGWTAWESLGGVLTSAPSVASWGGGRLDVFVRDLNNGLSHIASDGSSWSTWESLGGVLTSEPGAVSWGPYRIDVFVRASDQTLARRTYDGRWFPWQNLGGTPLASGPAAAAAWGPGRLDVFARSADITLLHRVFNTTWGDFESLGVTTRSTPAAATWFQHIDVFMQGEGDALWHTWYDGTW